MSKSKEQESTILQVNLDKENCSSTGTINVSASDLDLISATALKSTRGKSQTYQQYQFDSILDSFIRDKVINSKSFGEILEWKGQPMIRISRDRNVDLGNRIPFNCYVECDTFPEVQSLELPSSLEEPKVEISEEDIQNEVKKIISDNRMRVEKDGEAEDGDIIKFFFEFFYEKGSQKDEKEKEFLIGPNMDKQMHEKLVGIKAGEVVEHEIIVPSADELKDHPYRDDLIAVAGQKTKGKIYITKVLKLVDPSMDELLKKLDIADEKEFYKKVTDSLERSIKVEMADYEIAQVTDHLRTYDFPVPAICVEDSLESLLQRTFSALGLRYTSSIYADERMQHAFISALAEKNDFYKDAEGNPVSFESFMSIANKFAKKDVISTFMISKVRDFVNPGENELKSSAVQYLIENYSHSIKNFEDLNRHMPAAQRYVLLKMFFAKLKEEGKTVLANYLSIAEFDKKVNDYSRNSNIVYFNESK